MRRQIDVVEKFIKIHKLWQNRRRANGIGVESSQDLPYCSSESPRVAVKIERNTRKFYWTDHLHVDCSMTSCADFETIQTVFRQIISVNQLSLHGRVEEMCEECNTCHDGTRRPVVGRKSKPLFVPSVMKTHIPSTDDPAQEDLSQKYRERIEKLNQQDRLSKFCMDAGFLNVVEVGKYFMMQWPLPRDEDSSEPNGWIRGNTKIGPVLEVTTCCLQNIYGLEMRIKTILTRGSEFPMAWINCSQIWATWTKTTTTSRALLQEPYLLEKELGLMLNHRNIRSPIFQCRRN